METKCMSQESLPPEPAPTCIEVKGEGIEIQELLQKKAREQAWRIGENQVSDDTWSYVRYLNPRPIGEVRGHKSIDRADPVYEWKGGSYRADGGNR